MKLSNISSILEDFAPLSLQESYDNAGLLTGRKEMDITAALVCIDITEDVVDEAIQKECNLIISHHPLVFKGLKKITGDNYIERCVIKAIKNDIAIYSAHTNIDAVTNGVSHKMGEKLGLVNTRILSANKDNLKKLICYCPIEYSQKVRMALFNAGAGNIGKYDSCSYNINGEGTFKANKESNPFVGEKGSIHTEKETRIEVVLPKHLIGNVISAMKETHPYEEVAYDIISTEIDDPTTGFGLIGELREEIETLDFLKTIKACFKCEQIRHSPIVKKKIKTIALCGGSGSFLINDALRNKADIFISGDIKYHDYFTTEEKMIIADIGHYESEQFTKDIFYDLLTKKLPTFAVRFSEVNTNPINYI